MRPSTIAVRCAAMAPSESPKAMKGLRKASAFGFGEHRLKVPHLGRAEGREAVAAATVVARVMSDQAQAELPGQSEPGRTRIGQAAVAGKAVEHEKCASDSGGVLPAPSFDLHEVMRLDNELEHTRLVRHAALSMRDKSIEWIDHLVGKLGDHGGLTEPARELPALGGRVAMESGIHSAIGAAPEPPLRLALGQCRTGIL